MQMNKALSSIALLGALVLAAPAFAQPAAAPQPPSSYYPAPPPERAPVVERGASPSNLSSPLPAAAKISGVSFSISAACCFSFILTCFLAGMTATYNSKTYR